MHRGAFLLAMSAIFASTVGAFAQSPAPPATPPAQRPRWGQQAEKEFRLGRGLHQKMLEHAKEREGEGEGRDEVSV
jgi:hypothetical protein